MGIHTYIIPQSHRTHTYYCIYPDTCIFFFIFFFFLCLYRYSTRFAPRSLLSLLRLAVYSHSSRLLTLLKSYLLSSRSRYRAYSSHAHAPYALTFFLLTYDLALLSFLHSLDVDFFLRCLTNIE
ncbi:hypothetical protein BDN72DRAFT_167761 [Pluteus cervinus]|uniref:Uncharacterized protein n=1 Tax=Pluteus cervinus TaxID=181527 RepID=A0ACD3B6B3_9AGAR|nr:hypothetical protein BDN72DRAFT_167761 [Pluteus cervinus]